MQVMYYLQGHQTQYMHHSAMGPPPQPVQRKPANESLGGGSGAVADKGGGGDGADQLQQQQHQQQSSASPSNSAVGAEDAAAQRAAGAQQGVKGRDARGQELSSSPTTYVPYIPGQPLPQQVLLGADGKPFAPPTVQVAAAFS